MNKIKASIVVMSHLSDAQELNSCTDIAFNEANKRINFAKFVINKTNGDLTKQINPDKLWSEFIQQSTDKIYG